MTHVLSHKEVHDYHKEQRHERLQKGIYGVIQQPIIPKGVIALNEQPGYIESHFSAKIYRKFGVDDDGYQYNRDKRCFYTGVRCIPGPKKIPAGWNQDPRLMPWLGTKDHLVPARRHTPSCPVDLSKYAPCKVLSANVVNVTLGLAPLPIRLKIREWLSTVPFDKDDLSVEAGNNLRWIVINMMDDFRIKGRFPWSRKQNGQWWYPEISEPLMAKWWKMELEFLSLNEKDRDKWIKNFVYHF